MNEDGEKLLLDKELKHKKLDYGVTELLNSALEQGYLEKENGLQPVDNATQPSEGLSGDQPSESQLPGDLPSENQSLESQLPGDLLSENQPPESQLPGIAKDLSNVAAEPVDDGSLTEIEAGHGKAVIKNAVMFTVSSSNPKKSNALKKKIENTASKELSKDRVDSEILVGEASVEQRDAARKIGVTPGKLALIEDALEQEPERKFNDIKNAPVKDLVEIAHNNAVKKAEKEDIRKELSGKENISKDDKDVGKNDKDGKDVKDVGKNDKDAGIKENINDGNGNDNSKGSDQNSKDNSNSIDRDKNNSSSKKTGRNSTDNGDINVPDEKAKAKSSAENIPNTYDGNGNREIAGNSDKTSVGAAIGNKGIINDNVRSKDKIGKKNNDLNVKEKLKKSGDDLKKEREKLKDEFLRQIENGSYEDNSRSETDKKIRDKGDKEGKDKSNKKGKDNKKDKDS